MATKKTYKPKAYVPKAVDADNDGIVQEGTEFERPVETELVVETPRPTHHILQDGENIQTVAAMYLPEGWTRNEYAKLLFQLNGQVTGGQVVRLG
jgi:hypothetical protein